MYWFGPAFTNSSTNCSSLLLRLHNTARGLSRISCAIRHAVSSFFQVGTDIQVKFLADVQHVFFGSYHQYGSQADVGREVCILDGYHGIVLTNSKNSIEYYHIRVIP